MGSGAWFVTEAGAAKARRHRMDAYVRRASSGSEGRDKRADIKRKQISNKLKSLNESKKHSESRIGAVRIHIMRAGLSVTLVQFWTFCALLAVGTAAVMVVVMRANPASALGAAAFAGFALPQMFLRTKAKRRQREFTKYFGTAIDVIVRGLKSGLPPQECFRIIGREIPDPCGAEFRIVMDEVNAGLTMEEALDRSYERMPTQELRFFSTVIAVQQQTGGNLAEILGNISGVLRGRAALKEKIKALSSEAKMSSLIVGALPFFVASILTVVNYAYISLLWTTRVGEMILAGSAFLMTFGMWVMNRMGKLDM